MATTKKTTKKKTAKKAAPKKAAVAKAPAAVPCNCMKFGKFYYCMVQKPDGSFERCPTLARFKTLEACQRNSC